MSIQRLVATYSSIFALFKHILDTQAIEHFAPHFFCSKTNKNINGNTTAVISAPIDAWSDAQ